MKPCHCITDYPRPDGRPQRTCEDCCGTGWVKEGLKRKPQITDTAMLDWIEVNRPQICKVRESECAGDYIEMDTKDGCWRAKTLRSAIKKAMNK